MSNPAKRDPILDQFSMITRPYTRQNGLKTIPFPEAHTCIANIWEYPLPPWGVSLKLCTAKLINVRTIYYSAKTVPCYPGGGIWGSTNLPPPPWTFCIGIKGQNVFHFSLNLSQYINSLTCCCTNGHKLDLIILTDE